MLQQHLSAEETAASGKVLVAVIDASASHRRQVAQALTPIYRTITFDNADAAIAPLREAPPRAMLVDRSALRLDAYQFIKMLRRQRSFAEVPVIFTDNADEGSVQSAARECGADAYLAKPYRRSSLIRVISRQISKSVERKWETLPSLPRNALVSTLDVFTRISDVMEKGEPIAYATVLTACGPLVEAVGMREYKDILKGVRDHDNYSYAHSVGTATLLLLFGYTIGLKEPDLSLLATGGLLHDVGKLSIPPEVLDKPPASFTAEEHKVMQSHVPLTLQYLERCPDIPKKLLAIAAEHHERLDGSGYPLGLKGGALNELARMASIVDVFCELSEKRTYRPPLDAEQALRVMTVDMAAKLDQKMLGLFREMLLDAGN